MRPIVSTFDRYLLRNVAGTLAAVFAIVISLMTFEQLARSIEFVRYSGQKAYVVVSGLLALLPEFVALGALFALYMALALTVRRLSLRNELPSLEAGGVAPLRWMRMPVLCALGVAAGLLWLQGWLVPAGERGITDLNRKVVEGRFGYDLQSGEFIDLGAGRRLRFTRIEPATGELAGVFFNAGGMVFSAPRGRLRLDRRGNLAVDLKNGQGIDESEARVTLFSRFQLLNPGGTAAADAEDPIQARKGMDLPALLASGAREDRAEAWSRLMWPVMAVLAPFLALVLGKPRRPGIGFAGLGVGIGLILLCVRTTSIVETTGLSHPSALAALFALSWMAVAALLLAGERRWGEGYVDSVISRWALWIGRTWKALAAQRKPRVARFGG